jgi:RNA polymerase sigma-70 factor, ECF subfamily
MRQWHCGCFSQTAMGVSAKKKVVAERGREARISRADRRKAAEFEATVLPHRPDLYAFALRYTRDPADAEDLVQEALMRAFAAWGQFISGSNPRAWIFRILFNSFINTYRRRKRLRRLTDETPGDAVGALYGWQRPLAANDPAGTLLEQEFSDDVVRALDALSPTYRQVVELADVDGIQYREIATRLGVPMGTVMSRLFRARRQLESQLAEFAATDYGIRRCDRQLELSPAARHIEPAEPIASPS